MKGSRGKKRQIESEKRERDRSNRGEGMADPTHSLPL